MSNDWLTPPEIVAALGPFDLDPCSPIGRPWDTAARHLTIEDDGLAQPWRGRIWMNPPYDRLIHKWMRRMAAHDHGTAFVFVKTETEWFRESVWGAAAALLFLYQRVDFHLIDGTKTGDARLPNVLVAYGLDDADRLADSGLTGHFVPLACKGQIVAVLRGCEITWRSLIERVVRRAGGKVSLEVAYLMVSRHPKSAANPNWQAKVRQILQGDAFKRVARGNYELAV